MKIKVDDSYIREQKVLGVYEIERFLLVKETQMMKTI